MAGLLARHLSVLVVEFTPAAIANRVPPRKFLDRLGALGTLCDLGQRGSIAPIGNASLQVIPESGYNEYLRTVENRHYGWSDVLIIPHSMPNREALLATLAA